MANEFGRRRGCSWQPPVLILCVLTLAGAHCATAAAQRISTAELLSPTWSGGVTANTAFTPGSDAVTEHAPFLGTLRLTETEMTTEPAVFSPRSVLGRDPKLFPGVAISFFTDKGDLVPFTQDVIRYGSNNRGRSYWDIIVQPGRVWSQPDDSGWSRAGFPFALVNSIEGETHNGLATFLYKDGRVSNLRFQIVQQTAPFYIKDDFVAAGLVPATFAPVATDQLSSLKRGLRGRSHRCSSDCQLGRTRGKGRRCQTRQFRWHDASERHCTFRTRLSRYLLPEGVPERRWSVAVVRSRALRSLVGHQGIGE